MADITLATRPRAVQYVRMSTEHQRYSLDNQRAQIADYAAEHGYEIIGTYEDSGRSGLTLKERRGLNRLLRDVTDPERLFSTILVLDVSRWGRFQNPDEHAAYEFLCRGMGVRVRYVSELFADDDSFVSSMMKHIKRIMAGEYSRELSAKIAYAQIRGATRGFKQGGMIGYGLRRLLIDAHGQPKQELKYGERKSLSSDRVIVIPGPPDEQKIVRRIFEMFLEGAPLTSIPRHLNFVGVRATDGLPWTLTKVKSILTNEIYTGIYVFNRTSQKLKGPRVQNPQNLWVRIPICQGIISREVFDAAQNIMAVPRNGRSNSYSTDKMLDGLRRLLAEKGTLSTALIDRCPYIPHSSTYFAKFGSTANMYQLIGYNPKRTKKRRKRLPRTAPYGKANLIAQLTQALKEHGYLTRGVIDQCSYTASANTYANAFGNLTMAYLAAGYQPNTNRLPGKGIYDEADALRRLRDLFDRQGFINAKMVEVDTSLPTGNWYRRHFGSFAEAFARAGIPPTYGLPTRTAKMAREYLDRPDGGLRAMPDRVGDIPEEQLLATVRSIYAENGRINRSLIYSDPRMPSEHRISKRYRTLADLYAAAGLPAGAFARYPYRKPDAPSSRGELAMWLADDLKRKGSAVVDADD